MEEEEEKKKKKENGGFVCETLQRSKVLISWSGAAIAIAVDIQIFSNLRIVTTSPVESNF